MDYEIVTLPSPDASLPEVEVVIITRADGSHESFPVDEENPSYQQFLLYLESLKGA